MTTLEAVGADRSLGWARTPDHSDATTMAAATTATAATGARMVWRVFIDESGTKGARAVTAATTSCCAPRLLR